MQFKSILCVLGIALANPVFAHGEHGKPQYGGLYGEAGSFQAELVTGAGEVSLYLSVHGEALASQGATAKLTVLGAGDKRELVLSPAGANRLTAKLGNPLAKGSKAVASITLPGKPLATIRYQLSE